METDWFLHPYRCSKNVKGPFYTMNTCLYCGLPEAEAPSLLAILSDEQTTTYFVKQPVGHDEVVSACNAIRVCCVNDLRYGGKDREIINLLGNDPQYCDYTIGPKGDLVFNEPHPPKFIPPVTGWTPG